MLNQNQASELGMVAEHPAEHDDFRALFCGSCAVQPSWTDARPSKRRPSNLIVSNSHISVPNYSSTDHQSLSDSPDACLQTCDGCIVDNNCTKQCTLPCPGDSECSNYDACCDPTCDGSPCVEQCMDPDCTKYSCPAIQCLCQQCGTEACPFEDPWNYCNLTNASTSLSRTPYRHGDSIAPAQYGYHNPEAIIDSNSVLGFDFYSSDKVSHGIFNNYTRHSNNNPNILSPGFSPNGYATLSHSHFQSCHIQGLPASQTCSLGIPDDHCHLDQSCCHGYDFTCDRCPVVPQSHQTVSRSTGPQPSGPLHDFGASPQTNGHHLLPNGSLPLRLSYGQSSSSFPAQPITQVTAAHFPNSEELPEWSWGSDQFFDPSSAAVREAQSDLRYLPLSSARLSASGNCQVSSSYATSPFTTPLSTSRCSSTNTTTTSSPSVESSRPSQTPDLSQGDSSEYDVKGEANQSLSGQTQYPTGEVQNGNIPTCKWNVASNKSDEPIPCLKQFSNEGELHDHIKKHHVDVLGECFLCEWIGCGSCDNTRRDFKQRSKLSRHCLVHAGHRPYLCSFANCPKRFATNQAKDNHERTHLGHKPYKCDQCSYTTTTATQLKTHINAKHIKDKRYLCRTCEFACADSSNLSKHEKTHLGRPWGCPHPGCPFKPDCRWENVKRHLHSTGHCPELLVDGSPELIAYKRKTLELAKRLARPRSGASRVRRTCDTPRTKNPTSKMVKGNGRA